eukprot:CAMPEP_0178466990 /NCGR_PEP_ID=MMETSP0689_2-20121128/52186_1 /TAXON_ID=160604 /ORGANISM="Amphidinium massartii, Strain CS-259" /LENGTH=59 /DNA_ID=CAMNT_0020094027 /DNA_START=28 /DNA_END=207 /DNA_ORIENTATION=-
MWRSMEYLHQLCYESRAMSLPESVSDSLRRQQAPMGNSGCQKQENPATAAAACQWTLRE